MDVNAGFPSSPWRSLLICLAVCVIGDDHLRPDYSSLPKSERQGIEALIGELGNPDPQLRNLALRRLHSIGGSAVEPLAELLRKGSDPKRTSMACLVLGAIDSRRSLSAVEQAFLEGPKHPDVLRACLSAFALTRQDLREDVLKRMTAIATSTAPIEVQQIAWLALAARKTPNLSALIEEPLAKCHHNLLKGTLIVALAESDDPRAAELLVDDFKRFRSQDPLIRACLLFAAARLRGPVGGVDLCTLKVRDEELDALAIALGAAPVDATVGRLTELLQSSRDRAALAVFSLVETRSASSTAPLTQALRGDFGDYVRRLACLAVSIRPQQDWRDILVDALHDTDEETRANAALTLSWWREPLTLEVLRERLDQEKSPVVFEHLLLGSGDSDDRPIRSMIPEAWMRTHPTLNVVVDDLEAVRAHRLDERVLLERVASRLRQDQAHWLLQRQAMGERLMVRILDLDRITFRSEDEEGGGIPRIQPGGEDSEPPPSDGQEGGDGSQRSPFERGRRNKADFARFEVDLQKLLRDFPWFPIADPFLR